MRVAVSDAISRPQRLEALDVFRGLTIAGMIVVNNPGTWSAIYWPLAHADELASEHATGWYPVGIQAWTYRHWFAPLARPENASLAFAVWYLALWTALAWWLYREKVFVKI